MSYRCPRPLVTGSHCLYNCPVYGWYGFQRCLEHHQHQTPCSEECLLRVTEDVKGVDANNAWQAALSLRHDANAACARVEVNAHDALRTGEGLEQALADVLVMRQRQRTASTKEETRKWELNAAHEERRIRRGLIQYSDDPLR
ncbi:hypothetical protein MMC17_007911 [Xylographa soralifera]|nr:hypothetical protein [Xylographa soralifera]